MAINSQKLMDAAKEIGHRAAAGDADAYALVAGATDRRSRALARKHRESQSEALEKAVEDDKELLAQVGQARDLQLDMYKQRAQESEARRASIAQINQPIQDFHSAVTGYVSALMNPPKGSTAWGDKQLRDAMAKDKASSGRSKQMPGTGIKMVGLMGRNDSHTARAGKEIAAAYKNTPAEFTTNPKTGQKVRAYYGPWGHTMHWIHKMAKTGEAINRQADELGASHVPIPSYTSRAIKGAGGPMVQGYKLFGDVKPAAVSVVDKSSFFPIPRNQADKSGLLYVDRTVNDIPFQPDPYSRKTPLQQLVDFSILTSPASPFAGGSDHPRSSAVHQRAQEQVFLQGLHEQELQANRLLALAQERTRQRQGESQQNLQLQGLQALRNNQDAQYLRSQGQQDYLRGLEQMLTNLEGGYAQRVLR